MGAILERNGRARTVYIFVPTVERIIGHPVDGKLIHDGRKAHALARALARVLAHETVHAPRLSEVLTSLSAVGPHPTASRFATRLRLALRSG